MAAPDAQIIVQTTIQRDVRRAGASSTFVFISGPLSLDSRTHARASTKRSSDAAQVRVGAGDLRSRIDQIPTAAERRSVRKLPVVVADVRDLEPLDRKGTRLNY